MEEKNSVKLILKSKVIEIQLSTDDLLKINNEISQSLISIKQYSIKSNIEEKLFNSFLNFWLNDESLPLDENNVTIYTELNKEFKLISLSKIIEEFSKKRNSLYDLNQIESIIKFGDEDKLKEISENFEDYLDAYGIKMMSIDIDALFEMLNSPKQKPINQDKVYKLIQQYFYDTNKPNILILLTLLDKNQIKQRSTNPIINFLIDTKNNIFDHKYNQIYKAYYNNDIQLLQFFFGEEYQTNNGKITYRIDSKNKTAALCKVEKDIEDCAIPDTIKYNLDDYLVTSVIDFKYSNRSNLTLKKLHIPPNFKEFMKGCFDDARNLIQIEVSPKNQNFIFYDNKYLLGKTDPNSDNFDVLLFARRDIINADIPSTIKIIAQSAFSKCTRLNTINIPLCSELQTIEPLAFKGTSIESLYIPDKFQNLCQCSLFDVEKLTKIEVSPLNQHFKFIDSKYLLFKDDPKSENYDVLLFASRDIKKASISSNIQTISCSAFQNCRQMKTIDIPIDSKLEFILDYSFRNTGIKDIFIPKNVLYIGPSSFDHNLRHIEIAENSQLQKIDGRAFFFTDIKSFCIPRHVSNIGPHAFGSNMVIIEIPEKSELKNLSIENLNTMFITKRLIIMIPSNLNIMKS